MTNSQRSHYARRDLELLFKVSARAAGRLLDLLATEPVGTAHLVARERLSQFLEHVAETENVPGLVATIRAERDHLTRTKARYLYLRDEPETPLSSLPHAVTLAPGRLEIHFDKLEELVAHLVLVSLAMRDDPLAFAARCESPQAQALTLEQLDGAYIQSEIQRMDQELASRRKQPVSDTLQTGHQSLTA